MIWGQIGCGGVRKNLRINHECSDIDSVGSKVADGLYGFCTYQSFKRLLK